MRSSRVFGVELEARRGSSRCARGAVGAPRALRPRDAVAPSVVAVALVCIAFAVLDVGEVAHQVDRSNVGLAVIALVTTLGHLASGRPDRAAGVASIPA